MTRYCLDTFAYSRFRLGEPALTELIDLRSMSAALDRGSELLAAFRLGAHERRNTMELWNFLADPAADVLDVDVYMAERYSLMLRA